MKQRDLPPREKPSLTPGDEAGDGQALEEARDDAARLLAAADAAFERTRATDSLEFLRASRQHGGQ